MNYDQTRKVVPFERSRRMPDPLRIAEFAETARRLQREREESAGVVSRLLQETPREQWPELAQRAELRTSGALEHLAALAGELERDPQRSLAASELATAIADSIPEDSYPRVVLAQLRASAWKERARALCYLSRYDESVAALDRADAALAPFGTLAHDQAIIDFVRSIVLQHLRRFDEAQALLESCRVVFNDHGDVRLYRNCTVAAGNLLVRRGDYRAAREVLLVLLADGDAEATARARFALGWCAIHLGRADEALEHFADAARRLQQLGSEMEVVRSVYGCGSALLRLGRVDEAIERLTSARTRFLAHALVEEAGLCGLEIVEAEMLHGNFEGARTLASAIVHEFTKAALNRRAVAALAYLQDAIAASSATPEVVRNVHAYISSLKLDPAREFVPAGVN
ncbi:MAG TPA: tetratricopeptide repeat protein [Thermoanaerobaculia bacterium]